MRGYSGIYLSTSACVRFVRNSEVDGSESSIFEDVKRNGIRCAYLDPSSAPGTSLLASQLADVLKLDHAPYEERHWVCLLDDLIGLSRRERGLVVVIDKAWILLDGRRDELFDLVEAFLTQVHHWLERDKPCYLCFQMEMNSDITEIAREAMSVSG